MYVLYKEIDLLYNLEYSFLLLCSLQSCSKAYGEYCLNSVDTDKFKCF